MPTWNQNLTGAHYQIAADNSTPIHVLAGPGTGKTFAMMRKIARLLEEGNDSKTILAVTFTRTAAKDLKEQLSRLGIEGAVNVKSCTLHSLCFKILSEKSFFELTHRTPRPMLNFEKDVLISDLKGSFGGIKGVKRLLAAYEASWARMQTDIPGGPSEQIDRLFHEHLVSWLRYHRCMLIGELVPLTLQFIQNNPALEIVPTFNHVLVDEYQDLNKADQTLIDILSRRGSLTIIGDDSQSIYNFRHANPEGIRNFPATHIGTVAYRLEVCKRCPPNIVRISNDFITNDTRRTRYRPLIEDEAKPRANIYIVQHTSDDEEARNCADFIVHYLAEHDGLSAGQVIVLASRRFLGNKIRDALIERRQNALSFFSEDPLETNAAAEGFCLFTLLINWTLAKSGKSEPQLSRGTETQFNDFIGGAFPGRLPCHKQDKGS